MPGRALVPTLCSGAKKAVRRRCQMLLRSPAVEESAEALADWCTITIRSVVSQPADTTVSVEAHGLTTIVSSTI